MGFGQRKTAENFSQNPAAAKPSSQRKSAEIPIEKENLLDGMPPLFILAHGKPGTGKSSFFQNFPDVQFVLDPFDQGITTLEKWKQIPKLRRKPILVDDWESLIKTCDDALFGRVPCKTLVFESAIGFEKLCFARHCRIHYKNDLGKKGFYAFGAGPKSAARHEWPDFTERLRKLHAKGFNVILTAHTDHGQEANPFGEDYNRFSVKMDKAVWHATAKDFEAVLFFFLAYTVDKEEGALKAKVDPGSERRLIGCRIHPSYDAKNQYGLPALIECGDSHEEAFKNFVAALKGEA